MHEAMECGETWLHSVGTHGNKVWGAHGNGFGVHVVMECEVHVAVRYGMYVAVGVGGTGYVYGGGRYEGMKLGGGKREKHGSLNILAF